MANTTPIQRLMERHGLTQRVLSEGTALSLSNINSIVRGHRQPRADTVTTLLAYFRKFEPEITFDDLWGS
jgi:transcriptional regulator with XRE-family HTH domain